MWYVWCEPLYCQRGFCNWNFRNTITVLQSIWEERNEWKWMKCKEYLKDISSIILIGSLGIKNEKTIHLFRSLSRRKWNGQEGTLIPPISLKDSYFYSSQNWEELEETFIPFISIINIYSIQFPYNLLNSFLYKLPNKSTHSLHSILFLLNSRTKL